MSHTSTISAIKIVDINAFNQAVQNLRDQGLKIEVLHNQVPKAYSRGQAGMSEPALQCLRIEGAAYDVALYATSQGQHELRTDFFMGSVERALGANEGAIAAIDTTTPEGKEEREQARLGQLYQRYAINATMNTVAQQGGSVQEEIGLNGEVQLRIRDAA